MFKFQVINRCKIRWLRWNSCSLLSPWMFSNSPVSGCTGYCRTGGTIRRTIARVAMRLWQREQKKPDVCTTQRWWWFECSITPHPSRHHHHDAHVVAVVWNLCASTAASVFILCTFPALCTEQNCFPLSNITANAREHTLTDSTHSTTLTQTPTHTPPIRQFPRFVFHKY